jgi:hypothetical protein
MAFNLVRHHVCPELLQTHFSAVPPELSATIENRRRDSVCFHRSGLLQRQLPGQSRCFPVQRFPKTLPKKQTAGTQGKSAPARNSRRGEVASRFRASHAWHVSGKQNGLSPFLTPMRAILLAIWNKFLKSITSPRCNTLDLFATSEQNVLECLLGRNCVESKERTAAESGLLLYPRKPRPLPPWRLGI